MVDFPLSRQEIEQFHRDGYTGLLITKRAIYGQERVS